MTTNLSSNQDVKPLFEKPVPSFNDDSVDKLALFEMENVISEMKKHKLCVEGVVEIKKTYFSSDDLSTALTSWGHTGIRSLDLRHCHSSNTRHEGWLFYSKKLGKKCFVFFSSQDPVKIKVVFLLNFAKSSNAKEVISEFTRNNSGFVRVASNTIVNLMFANYGEPKHRTPECLLEITSPLVMMYPGKVVTKEFTLDNLPAMYRNCQPPLIGGPVYEVSFNTASIPRFLFVPDFHGAPKTFTLGTIEKIGSPPSWKRFTFNEAASGIARFKQDKVFEEMLKLVRRKLG